MAPRKPVPRSITVKLHTTRKGAEAFRLEIERLARRLGIPATAIRIRRLETPRH